MGIYLCYTEEELVSKFETAAKQGEAFFGNAGVFVEKYVQHAHHVEVQIFGDGKGCVVHLGERECSIQRRHQKILEETPSVLVTEDIRERLTAAAVRLCSAVKYRSAGTVEFLVDSDTKEFYFLEVNTRLQVEHGITEMVNGGVDLVEWMLRVQLEDLPAADFSPKTDLSSFTSRRSGWAIEVRVCAEDPTKDFTPSPGVLGQVAFPEDLPGVRVDTWIETGTAVSTFYDSLLGKVMVHADTREAAISMLETALAQTHIKGIPTNLGFLRSLIASEKFKSGNTTTRFLEDFEMVPDQIEVLDAGMQTTVQDYPGRVGLWHVGVPPSGAMDDFSFQLANALVGNDSKAAGLEFTLKGPTLKFTCDSLIALTGAHFEALLDEVPVPWWTSVKVQAGQVLRVKGTDGDNGVRGYLAVWGGLDVPDYLGSKSTFPGGNLGGHQGRALRVGDTINIQPVAAGLCDGVAVPLDWRPELPGLGKPWEVQVLPGPQAAPDYFVEEDIKDLYNTQYVVHYNSNRLGVRFQGPRPRWARKDGGEGGSHPSNVHDHVYAIGTINYTGDMPIVLTCDGPSLGGFVCPATIISTELWKMGQVRPNDAVVWCQTTLESAYSKCRKRKLMMRLLCSVAQGKASVDDAVAELSGAEFDVPEMPEAKAVLKRLSQWCHPGAQYRLAGDRYVLVEYGPMELDINLRVRVHMLEKWLADRKVEGLVETNPGVRSCMIEYDQVKLPLSSLLSLLDEAESALPDVHNLELPVRVLHLPMAFNEKWTHEAIHKYTRSVRNDAPYLPSNVDFVARNNGLDGADDVKSIVMGASYMVLGLGDVYLGAPCAVPVDPRHRLVVPKYNPARTFTPEGAVGIGGSYMCIYPMSSPGGYQLVGRTLPIWNTFGRIEPFNTAKPWLLEIFDQVRFYEVTEDELEQARFEFAAGQAKIKIEEEVFKMKEYNEMVESVKEETSAMRAKQRAAMAVQMDLDAQSLKRLNEAETSKSSMASMGASDLANFDDDDKYVKVLSRVMGNIWDILVKEGDKVDVGQTVIVLEAMKMEYAITTPSAGTVRAITVERSQLAEQGTTLVVVEV
ncbi:unnamed protein product [Ostreobium quekettii]|uniref:Uncharacterized protein n=1 Tax=Ostreobium quekettii TaxID=121088 RepID=A0A8S1J7C1_9CHLO|nr:unnamed protein product [Ostreobium quekettii]